MLADEIKETLRQFNRHQAEQFPHADIMALLQQRSAFYDALLCRLWQQFGLNERHDLALIAVGGYGRKEMFPLSDLDILILCEKPLDQATLTELNRLFNLLWDGKFQLGSSIRTLEESLQIGKQELSVATNMLESRFIIGNIDLWQQLIEQLYQDDFWTSEQFFYAKKQEKEERYARYHNTSYNLEPDLKHSPGGLRDLHLLGWIMLRHYRIHTLEDLLEHGILFPEEYHELQQAQNVLFQMRFALHLQLKRYDNRLRFDRQLKLSEQLGYEGEGNHAVETMMKTFFQATHSISQLSQLILNSFEQNTLQILQKKSEKRPLDRNFSLQDNRLYCEDHTVFEQSPETILTLFHHLTQLPHTNVSAMTLRHLRLALQKQRQPLSEIPAARQCFLTIFQQPNMVKRAILPMHQLGVLTAYLPQWQAIQGLMQFDLFHIYTVDEHTIRVMLKLESFLEAETAERHPLCTTLFPTLEKRPLLYLAALCHDIAKGRQGDHSQLGAIDMYQFAKQHGFSEEECDYMAWLVAEHLSMSITAQRRDIHDPEVIREFAQIVKTPLKLKALTCLTVADICATNESLWNDWKRSLIRHLFELTEHQLTLGQEECIDYQQIAANHRKKALSKLVNQLSEHESRLLESFWQTCPDSYFVIHHPRQLIWHAQHYLTQQQFPMVLVSNQHARGATEIFIYCVDQPQLFARIAYTLSQKKVSVHDAQIITGENGRVLDSFIVTESDGTRLSADRCVLIQQALFNTVLQTSEKPFNLVKQPVKHQSFKRKKTRVRFLSNSQPNTTAFELFTLDREGLLAQVSHIFNQQQLNLINAKISTIGERVEDFFVVTTKENRGLSEEERERLKVQIQQELDS